MDELRFDRVFGDSWIVFKTKFNLFFTLAVLLYIIPNIMIGIYELKVLFPKISEISQSFSLSGLFNAYLSYLPFMVLSGLLHLFLIVSTIYVLAKKNEGKDISFQDTIKGAFPFFGKSILLGALLLVSLIFLFILLIIPGIIFSIYWAFSFYALITDKCSITESMKHSKKAVKGRWWRVFGYMLIVGLILGLMNIIVSLIFHNPLSSIDKAPQLDYSSFMNMVINMTFSSFTTIFGFIFMERLYLELKKEKETQAKTKVK